jgi:hypothetical protein
MPNRSAEVLFQLIKSLEKSEKRNFKLFVKRHSSPEDLKITVLFDALDKMTEYNEEQLLKKNPSISKQQLSNLKAHLYKQLLTSLRSLADDNIELQLNEQMDFARILYNKGLYQQCLKTLDKTKSLAKSHNQVTYWLQALIFEKKIEALHITRSFGNRAELLSQEVDELNDRLNMIGKLSNLSLQLYSWYIRLGHARDSADVELIKEFFQSNLPANAKEYTGFYERLYLCQSYCWYSFVLQDLITYYRYSQKWFDLFQQETFMQKVETMHYIKGMHNLLTAHFMLGNYEKFDRLLEHFDTYTLTPEVQSSTNHKTQSFIYLYSAKINKHFLEGTFSEGLYLVNEIEEKLVEFELQLDRHRILVFYYKIACLYFGSGDNDKTISYLNRIIHSKVDLRTDLQCYARLLHLIAHYELGNWQLIEYLSKSVYRFMAKMQNLTVVEEEMFAFLKNAFHLPTKEIPAALHQLKSKLEMYKINQLQSRSFMYLDVISWIESKLQHVPVQKIIKEKFDLTIKRKQQGNIPTETV